MLYTPLLSCLVVPALLACQAWAQQTFTIAGGQVYTPGIVILNAPQPGTPLGGETLHVSLDVTANGKLNLPPYVPESPTQIHNITMFLYSRDTGLNLTINNGSAEIQGSERLIMSQQPGSTVKHINWPWPECLVGDGQPRGADDRRGAYNISIRQNFRLNGQEHYTIFDVPISVTNRIDGGGRLRPSCESLNNPLLSETEVDVRTANDVGILFAPGDATQVQFIASKDKDLPDNGLGPPRGSGARGIGSGNIISWAGGALWTAGVAIVLNLLL
ncbi:hypothetical protein PpBr36_01122 [Pyricularia pennisetigena]|uniref:hypothetical protein n=1 Tax=Pyricularia pennisetigena TaxID=1578925 RepID=UPI001151E7C1|nr:hypothetical protein PpBr36_01122 [Pyricularia pennisetigena]TLS28489.1 hypothetical protein PpBr36_01122 [Pyricularia pennisetigena]